MNSFNANMAAKHLDADRVHKWEMKTVACLIKSFTLDDFE